MNHEPCTICTTHDASSSEEGVYVVAAAQSYGLSEIECVAKLHSAVGELVEMETLRQKVGSVLVLLVLV